MEDYQSTSGDITFEPGERFKTIYVPIVADDLYEADELFYVQLSNPQNAALGDFQASGTVEDDDFDLTVTTTADDNLPDGRTSLREAIEYANRNPGPDVIDFKLGRNWYTETHTCFLNKPLPDITEAVTIDGYSVSGSKPGTDTTPATLYLVLQGASNSQVSHALRITGNDSVVRGLNIRDFGTGVIIDGGQNNRIEGCFIGTNVLGTVAASAGTGIVIQNGAKSNVIGGKTLGTARNIISGNSSHGVLIRGTGTDGNLVQGNIIGLDARGLEVLGNGECGVVIEGRARGNQIGGISGSVGARNIIAGNKLHGIWLSGALETKIQGNLIGIRNFSLPMFGFGNMWDGIALTHGAVLNQIGGAESGAQNYVAHNLRRGIGIYSYGTLPSGGNRLQGNLIYNNFQLGIDLVSYPAPGENHYGVTPNDHTDTDTGPNNSQNFPVLTSVAIENRMLGISGTLQTLPNREYEIEVYRNQTADASGHGEGETFVARKTMRTDANGKALFSVTLNEGFGITGYQFAATATDVLSGDTSEFSPVKVITSTLPLVVNTTQDVIANDGQTSLREAILYANSKAGADTITFNIPGSGVQTIALNDQTSTQPFGAAFPTITDTLTIDGYSQPGSSRNTLAVGNNAKLMIEIRGEDSSRPYRALTLGASNCVIQGLVINRFFLAGVEILRGASNNTIRGCYIGTNATGTQALPFVSPTVPQPIAHLISIEGNDNTVGGVLPADRNVISGSAVGVSISGKDNVVQGNYIGTNASGTAAIPGLLGIALSPSIIFPDSAVQQSPTRNLIGGTKPGAANIISGHSYAGIFLTTSSTHGNLIQGNIVGLNVTGTAALPNARGVSITEHANRNTIGGAQAGAGNIISGNGTGIMLGRDDEADSGVTANRILGNTIGLNLAKTQLIPNGNGISFWEGAYSNFIGGLEDGESNTIVGNINNGITAQNNVPTYYRPLSGNLWRGNRIHSNGKLGIDLGNNDITANDALDVDQGPNTLQNFPVISIANADNEGVQIKGTLHSKPASKYSIDFYRNVDNSGRDEGELYLQSTSVTTDSNGNANFSVRWAAGNARNLAGQTLTAIAIEESSGNSSEFSAPFAIKRAPVTQPDNVSVLEDGSIEIDVKANDHSLDAGNLTVTEVATSANTHGTVAINATNNRVKFVPEANYHGQSTFTYTAQDEQGGFNSATVTVNVLSVNDAPTFKAGRDVSVDEDSGGYAVMNWATDISAGAANENGQTLSFVVSIYNPALFSVPPAVSTEGILTFTLAPDANGSTLVTVQLQDNGGDENGGYHLSEPRNFTITVNPVSDAPGGVDDQITIDEDQVVDIPVLQNDIAAAGRTLRLIELLDDENKHGTTSPNFDNTIRFVPEPNYSGPARFRYRISDQYENYGVATVFVTIRPVNDAPQAVDDNVVVEEDSSVTVEVLKNDSDVDGDALQVVEVGAAQHGNVTRNSDNTLTYTPREDFYGTDRFTYTISDRQEGRASATVFVAVNSVAEVLTLNLSQTDLGEDASPITATVTRNGSTTQALEVLLSSQDETGATVPSRVVIPVGSASATFVVTPVNDKMVDGTQSVVIHAEAVGFYRGFALLGVTDDDVAVPGAPTVRIMKPYLNQQLPSLTSIEGTVTGVGSLGVRVKLQRASDNKYWTGQTWKVDETSVQAMMFNQQWAMPHTFLLKGYQSVDGRYRLYATVRDSRGQEATSFAQFWIDSKAPQVTFVSPTNSSTLSSLNTVSSRAVDAAGGTGVARVEYVLRRLGDGRYWNGRGWGTSPVLLNSEALSSHWTRRTALPTGGNLPTGSYRLQAVAVDRAGNRGISQITVNIARPVNVARTPAVKLSSATLNSSESTIALNFTGGLAADSATELARYYVEVDGVAVPVESVFYQAALHRLTVELAPDVLRRGSRVLVRWKMRDTAANPLNGQTELIVR